MERSFTQQLSLRFLGLALAASVAVVSALAQPSTVRLTDPDVIALGKELYTKNCAVGYCHGPAGRPARGPDMRDKQYEPDQLFSIVHDGIPETTMPAWENILSERDIWTVVAYVMSLSGGAVEGSAVEIASSGVTDRELTAQEEQGRELFFNLNNQKRCSICHQLGSMGSPVGPNLALSAVQKDAEQLIRDILEPGASIAPGFDQTVVITESGGRAAGIQHERTDEYIKIFDTASIPPPLRTFYSDEIRRVETAKQSSMPAIYDDMYSRQELEAIVAYLKSGAF